MKALKLILPMLLLAALMVGCGKVEKVLPKKDGKWQVTSQETRYYTHDNLDSMEVLTSGLPVYTFNSDGTGSVTEGSNTTAFVWSVEDDSDDDDFIDDSDDDINICQEFGGAQVCLEWDVRESSNKTQKWSAEIEDPSDDTKIEIDMNMERVD